MGLEGLDGLEILEALDSLDILEVLDNILGDLDLIEDLSDNLFGGKIVGFSFV